MAIFARFDHKDEEIIVFDVKRELFLMPFQYTQYFLSAF